MITRETQVEDLMRIPGVLVWCIQHGFSPFSCSGAFPGTFGKLLELKGVKDADRFIQELNEAMNAQGPC
ncbi:MAG: hypothetical protein P4L36_14745 [Holophaga sp.]|nr:hypothetical protein [Holophaga sp.]